MTDKFISQALAANLAETRYKNIVIPKSHQFFITLSESYYGIQKRASECLIEYSHPYSNRTFVIEQLREITLGDFWYYSKLQEAEKAYNILLDVFNSLLKSDIKQELQIQIIQTLLEFVELLTNQENIQYGTIAKILKIFQQNLASKDISFIKSSKSFIKYLSSTVLIPEFNSKILLLTKEILCRNILFWEKTTKIEQWYQQKKTSFTHDYSNQIDTLGSKYYQTLRNNTNSIKNWEKLVKTIPSYHGIAETYRDYTNEFHTFIEKFYFSFYLLHLPGMAHLQNRLIWDINKMLRNALDEIPYDEVIDFTNLIFNLSEELRADHISSVLDYLLTLGKKIIDIDTTEAMPLVAHFEKKLITFGFESPGIVYVNQDWQLSVNENHIKNIRVWLELIEYPHTILEKLLATLIVYLKIGGIFISDTDLFQRDITKILNSNIAPYFKRVKQLTRIFPVFFNEIGAEGNIRNYTTAIDELSGRQDRLVHFLRKQIHTESNNTLIELTRKIFYFWYDRNLDAIKSSLPPDVFESIDLTNEWYEPLHKMLHDLCRMDGVSHFTLLDMKEQKFDRLIDNLPDENTRDKNRLKYIKKIYSLLKEKYSFDTVDIISILHKFPFLDIREVDEFGEALHSNNFEKSLKMIYHFMELLKQIIFNPNPSEGWENIYHKRHIAIGIPSMYGVYREDKFEALGLTFRLEKIATQLMEKVVDRINLQYISAKTLNGIFNILEYFKEGLELDGIYNQGFNSNLQMLKYSLTSRSFSLDQYVNIFQFIAEDVKRTINKYFLKSYEEPLKEVVPKLFKPEHKHDDRSKSQLLNKKSEEFYRDILSSAFLIQPLDNLISRILLSLRNMVDMLSPELIDSVMLYNSDLVISPLYKETVTMDNQIFLGSKGYYLKKLFLAGFPVPEGFVLTTEAFRTRTAISNHVKINEEMDRMISHQIKELEKMSGKEFGNPKNPLLLSVRSGTAISMPGAMNTFLNVGMNFELVEELSKQKNFGWTSWDSFRRLLQIWGMANGIERDVFDQVIQQHKTKHHIDQKASFEPAHMKQIALAYKKVLDENRVYFEQNLFKQLKSAINYVFDSWSAHRAMVYRDHLQIADEWGTAVVIQRMILGNLHKNSGTGVFFTQNPNDRKPGVSLYGDFTFCSQGEDIVSGLVHTMPVAEKQKKQTKVQKTSLELSMPQIYRKIREIAEDMTENYGYSPQEIEFTFESENPEDVFILQTRDLYLKKQNIVNIFNPSPEKMQLVGRGIGIGGGALNGRLAFDMEDLVLLRKKHADENHILVRPDTVPDDIGMIFECTGLLTAKGGATSHAAVTAVSLGIVCIVNCIDLLVNEKKKVCTINGIQFKSGDMIAIDGNLGNIYKGNYPIEQSEVLSGI